MREGVREGGGRKGEGAGGWRVNVYTVLVTYLSALITL